MSSVIGAGTLADETKRHSRSLDLHSKERIAVIRHLHQRSASESDGLDLFMAAAATTEEPTVKQQQTSSSVFSIYKKFGSFHTQNNNSNNKPPSVDFINKRSKSRSSIGFAFANLRQPSFTTRKSSNRYSSCVPMTSNSGKEA